MKSPDEHLRGRRGLTLFELLVAVSMVLILAALLVYFGLHYITTTTYTRVRQEHRVLSRALQNYEVDFHDFPGNDNGLNALTVPVAYLSSVPTDPFHDEGAQYRYFPRLVSQYEWLIVSVGPDGDLDIEDLANSFVQNTGTPIESPAPHDRRYDMLERFIILNNYDPTNGVYSSGDVITSLRRR